MVLRVPKLLALGLSLGDFAVDQQDFVKKYDKRITAALSRARHGMFIIAGFPLLLKNDLWRQYLHAAVQTTPVVLPHYLDAMTGDERRNAKGILLARDGSSMVAPLQINR
ncbi:unnamed protein product, partial [Gongylonema pulchrum]|uniref:SanA protein n=1 Tax=Gongylonema pulchrum TaxID=637853 RepID=A0A183EUX4_9BILA